MKYYETNYDEYLSSHDTYSLHPELEELKSAFPKHISDFKNLIIYGSAGVGKYTQALTILQKYSPSKLKYDKKISVTYEKQEKKTKTSSTTSKVVPSNLHSGEDNGVSSTTNTTNKKKKTETGDGNMTSILQLKKIDKKQEYTYRISDIHYEIDMATLGCNSKLLWHDLFFQIVDIISVSLNPSTILNNEHKNKKEEGLRFSQENKTLRENSSATNKIDKIGIILCKNFHAIHNELLDIFYSYIRHPLHHFNIQIKFILLTEHVGFIPDNIMNACQCISVKRPSRERYLEMVKIHQKPFSYFSESLGNHNSTVVYDKVTRTAVFPKKKTVEILEEIDLNTIMNIKEIHSFASLKSVQDIPTDVFNMITDALLDQILHPENLKITELRNHLYELLIYNVDISECIWHIFISLIKCGSFSKKEHITEMMNEIFVFFKYYNNNYRSIYHLESIMLSMLNKIHYSSKHVHNKFDESLESGSNARIK